MAEKNGQCGPEGGEKKAMDSPSFKDPGGLIIVDLNAKEYESDDSSNNSEKSGKKRTQVECKRVFTVCLLIFFLALVAFSVTFAKNNKEFLLWIQEETGSNDSANIRKEEKSVIDQTLESDLDKFRKCKEKKQLHDCCDIWKREEYIHLYELCSTEEILNLLDQLEPNSDDKKNKRKDSDQHNFLDLLITLWRKLENTINNLIRNYLAKNNNSTSASTATSTSPEDLIEIYPVGNKKLSKNSNPKYRLKRSSEIYLVYPSYYFDYNDDSGDYQEIEYPNQNVQISSIQGNQKFGPQPPRDPPVNSFDSNQLRLSSKNNRNLDLTNSRSSQHQQQLPTETVVTSKVINVLAPENVRLKTVGPLLVVDHSKSKFPEDIEDVDLKSHSTKETKTVETTSIPILVPVSLNVPDATKIDTQSKSANLPNTTDSNNNSSATSSKVQATRPQRNLLSTIEDGPGVNANDAPTKITLAKMIYDDLNEENTNEILPNGEIIPISRLDQIETNPDNQDFNLEELAINDHQDNPENFNQRDEALKETSFEDYLNPRMNEDINLATIVEPEQLSPCPFNSDCNPSNPPPIMDPRNRESEDLETRKQGEKLNRFPTQNNVPAPTPQIIQQMPSNPCWIQPSTPFGSPFQSNPIDWNSVISMNGMASQPAPLYLINPPMYSYIPQPFMPSLRPLYHSIQPSYSPQFASLMLPVHPQVPQIPIGLYQPVSSPNMQPFQQVPNFQISNGVSPQTVAFLQQVSAMSQQPQAQQSNSPQPASNLPQSGNGVTFLPQASPFNPFGQRNRNSGSGGVPVAGPGGQYYVCNPVPPPSFVSSPFKGIGNGQVIDIRTAEPVAYNLQELLEYSGQENLNVSQREALECPIGEASCSDGSKCIRLKFFCDGDVNCEDASDEISCTCKQRVGELRYCDGYLDCPEGEDEVGCFGCQENEFSCDDWSKLRRATCINMNKRCDGVRDCDVTGKDEEDCFILTDHVANQQLNKVSNSVGFLHRNFAGKWYPVCLGTEIWAFDVCKIEAGPSSVSPKTHMMLTSDDYNGPYVNILPNRKISIVNSCVKNRSPFVECPPLFCGLRVTTKNPYRTSEVDTSIEEALNDFERYNLDNDFGRTSQADRIKDTDESSTQSTTTTTTTTTTSIINTQEASNDSIVGISRVVGGRASQPAAWPWMVTIYKNGIFHCGGVLINEIWVMTAAHCVDKYWQYYYEIQSGILRRFSYSPMEQTRYAVVAIPHEGYDKASLKNDIALMKLSAPIRYNRYVRPICLPSETTAGRDFIRGPRPGTICTVVGWGATIEHGADPDHMREVEVPVLKHCKYTEDEESNEICAGLSEGGKDACQGDSGGPFMCKNPNNPSQWYLAGIVSHGEGCARPHEPGVYTRVSLYVGWIAENIREDKFFRRFPLRKCPGHICKGTKRCLPMKRRCDKIVDCLYGDDEYNCANPLNYFKKSIKMDDDNGGKDLFMERPEVIELRKTQSEARAASSSDENDVSRDMDEWDDDSGSEENSADQNFRKSEEYFRCKRMLQVIPAFQKCDRIIDCEDGTDEMDCKCVEYIKHENRRAICDGITDCYDLTDELDCLTCNSTEFLCRLSKKCIPTTQRCNNVIDCEREEDETDCVALTNGLSLSLDSDHHPELSSKGIITINEEGDWKPLCTNVTANNASIASNVCNLLGLEEYKSFFKLEVDNRSLSIYKNHQPQPQLNEENKTKSSDVCTGLYIKCSNISLERGLHKVDQNDSPVESELWYTPWNAVVYSEGEYKCMGVIVDSRWVLTPISCLLSSKGHYITVLLGKGKGDLNVQGPHEQIIPVDTSHQVNESSMVLLHLQNDAQFSRYVKPIALDLKLDRPLSHKCVAVGLHKGKARFVFFKHTSGCSNGWKCFKLLTRIKSKCASDPWSGVISCDSRSGWYPSAVFHKSDGFCGFKEINRYADVRSLLDDILKFRNEVKSVSVTALPSCDGFRCTLGNCIEKSKICNGVPDCRNGEDESFMLCRKTLNDCMLDGNCECLVSELRCGNGRCVPKQRFCDKVDDCGDLTDEPDVCSCGAYLTITNSTKICDGVLNCGDRTDEDPKICHCREDSFHCGNSTYCVSEEMVCDGVPDCPGSEDEANCYSLKEYHEGSSSGEILTRTAGEWHKGCFPPVVPNATLQEICAAAGYPNREPYQLPLPVEITRGKAERPQLDDFSVVWIQRSEGKRMKLRLRNGRQRYVTFKGDEECYRLFVKC